MEKDWKDIAECNRACFKHLADLVKSGKIAEAVEYIDYCESLVRLVAFAEEVKNGAPITANRIAFISVPPSLDTDPPTQP